MSTVTFKTGQRVWWPRAPLGWAQIEDLRRRRVGLLYVRHGRLCRAVVQASTLAAVQAVNGLLPGMPEPPGNPLERGVVVRAKTFEVRV